MKEKGFTLVEILVYVAILGVVVASFVSFAISIASSRGKVYVQQEVQANARVALNLITQKIISANGVNFSSSNFDSDLGVLSLSMADNSKNPTIISLTGDDGQIQIQEGTDPALPVTSNEVRVTNLVFTNLTSTSDKPNIKIDLTVESLSSSDVSYGYNYNLETAVSLRQ